MRFILVVFILFLFDGAISQNFSFSSSSLSADQTHICWKVLFSLGEGDLLDQPQAALDSVFNFLIKNPTVKIEIGQHTENRGQPEQNLILSQKRAESIKNYLIAKGIESSRLISKGYGSSKPYFTKEQEIERARTTDLPSYPRNNRTTITIIGL